MLESFPYFEREEGYFTFYDYRRVQMFSHSLIFRRVWTPEMEWSVWCRGQSPWWFHHILSSSLVHFHRLNRPLEKKKQFDYSANKIRNKMRKNFRQKKFEFNKKVFVSSRFSLTHPPHWLSSIRKFPGSFIFKKLLTKQEYNWKTKWIVCKYTVTSKL